MYKQGFIYLKYFFSFHAHYSEPFSTFEVVSFAEVEFISSDVSLEDCVLLLIVTFQMVNNQSF